MEALLLVAIHMEIKSKSIYQFMSNPCAGCIWEPWRCVINSDVPRYREIE